MIVGKYCKTFDEATHGMPQGISMNAPYRFHWLTVERVEKRRLHCRGGDQPFEMPISRGRDGVEYVDLTINDPFFGPQLFKVLPFVEEKRE